MAIKLRGREQSMRDDYARRGTARRPPCLPWMAHPDVGGPPAGQTRGPAHTKCPSLGPDLWRDDGEVDDLAYLAARGVVAWAELQAGGAAGVAGDDALVV